MLLRYILNLIGFVLCTTLLPGATRPNIIVIICDDLGYGDLACYGHPNIKTPNLDTMAAEGVRFTDFYSTAPVCSPSRVGLMTGRSPNRAGVYDWIPEGNAIKPDAREQVHMRHSEVTIPKLLKKAGYATAMAGKWHCNSLFNSPDQPQPGDAGFDHWLATQNNAAPSHANPTNFVRNGVPEGPMEGYSCQLVADEGINWITDHQKKNPEQPFFFYMAFHEPHEPIASPEEIVATYRSVAVTEKEATYFANVENMDRAVGKVLSTLKDLSIDRDTLVVFTSDNGPETLSRYPNASYSWGRPDPLRGMKLWTTDAGFRVAGIMRWPENIKPGQTVSHPISALDLLPTFCNLADVKPPINLELDGANFMSALENKPIKRTKPLVWAYYNAINEHRVAMRDGKWKVLARLDLPKIQNLHTGNFESVTTAQLSDFEIYDMTKDLGETNNLAGKNKKLSASLTNKLKRSYKALLNSSYVWMPQKD
jgi:arylsulfatase A